VWTSASFHVAAHGYGQSQSLDRQAADDEDRSRRGGGKQDKRGDGEKESGWHDQQSGVFHRLSFPGNSRRQTPKAQGMPE
jgi:hypothetical protein